MTKLVPASRRLVFGELACTVCPYGVSGRCEGEREATAESFISRNEFTVGCTEPALQIDHYLDLHSRIEKRRNRLLGQPHINLPPFIPQLCTGLKHVPDFDERVLFSVSLSTVLDREGRVKYRSPEGLRRALKVPSSTRLGLVGTAIDYTIERFWEHSEERDSWKKLAALNFEFSTNLTYSVWNKQQRFDQILNQEKNLATHHLLTAHNIISVPFLFFYSERDYEEVLTWLKNHKDVQTIAVLAQFHRSRFAFNQMLNEMQQLERDISRRIHFLVVGPCSAIRIDRLFSMFERVSIVSHQPVFKATRGKRTLGNLRHVSTDVRIPIADLATYNVERYLNYCAAAKRARRTNPEQPVIVSHSLFNLSG